MRAWRRWQIRVHEVWVWGRWDIEGAGVGKVGDKVYMWGRWETEYMWVWGWRETV